MAILNKDAAYQKNVDSIYQISVSANRESYARLVKEDPKMCEALRDLMRDDLIRERETGEINMLLKLLEKGRITVEDAATEAGMTVEKFKETYLPPVLA